MPLRAQSGTAGTTDYLPRRRLAGVRHSQQKQYQDGYEGQLGAFICLRFVGIRSNQCPGVMFGNASHLGLSKEHLASIQLAGCARSAELRLCSMR